MGSCHAHFSLFAKNVSSDSWPHPLLYFSHEGVIFHIVDSTKGTAILAFNVAETQDTSNNYKEVVNFTRLKHHENNWS